MSQLTIHFVYFMMNKKTSIIGLIKLMGKSNHLISQVKYLLNSIQMLVEQAIEIERLKICLIMIVYLDKN